MYVTLLSHAGRKEFPSNQANWFKNRFPHPLRLDGGNWQVGLSAISIPDTGLHLSHLVPQGEDVFQTATVQTLADNTLTYKFHNITVEDLKDDHSIVDGVSFMKAVIRWLEQQRVNDFKHDYGSVSKQNSKHTHFNTSGKVKI